MDTPRYVLQHIDVLTTKNLSDLFLLLQFEHLLHNLLLLDQKGTDNALTNGTVRQNTSVSTVNSLVLLAGSVVVAGRGADSGDL